jgi:hypothetical protein
MPLCILTWVNDFQKLRRDELNGLDFYYTSSFQLEEPELRAVDMVANSQSPGEGMR